MIKARLIILLCFILAFGAGICVGILWQRQTKPPQDGWLAELNLSPEQRERIRAIWTDPQRSANRQMRRERREAAQKERDDALKALLSNEQKPRYEELLSACQKKLDEIAQEARKASDDAYERTRVLLTESQRTTYDELRRKRMEARSKTRAEPAGKQPVEQAPDKGSTSSDSEQKKDGGR